MRRYARRRRRQGNGHLATRIFDGVTPRFQTYRPLKIKEGTICRSRSGRLRWHHSRDKDGRCVFCDHLKPTVI